MGAAAPVVEPDIRPAAVEEPDVPYVVLLHNDDVNQMAAVAYILQRIFGYDEDTAMQLMMTAHAEGKAAVWTGERDRAVGYARQLHTYGLQATVAKDR